MTATATPSTTPPRRRSRLRWIALVAATPILALAGMSVASCSAPALGLRDGRLTPLPTSPNCVSSLATNADQRVEPLPLVTPPKLAREALRRIVLERPRTSLVRESDGYLRFECTSLVFRFRDDLEFHIEPADQCIHVRSSSRVGYSDFGANRSRVDAIRKSYEEWSKSARPK